MVRILDFAFAIFGLFYMSEGFAAILATPAEFQEIGETIAGYSNPWGHDWSHCPSATGRASEHNSSADEAFMAALDPGWSSAFVGAVVGRARPFAAAEFGSRPDHAVRPFHRQPV
jgi:hypothetical protein